MSTPRGYRKANPLAGLTRIEMLLALYDRALHHLDQIGSDQDSGNEPARALHEFKAQKLVAGLAAGVIPDGSPLADNLARLLEYCQHQIATGQPVPARRTLAKLREAYAEVRSESNQLEGAGIIPPIELTSAAFEVMA